MTATRSASGSVAISRYTRFVSSGCSVHCKPEHEADRPRRDLARHRHAVGVRRGQQLELAAVRVAAHLHERERQRPARLLGHAPEDRELGVDVGEVGDALQHALARLADRARDADQLVGLGGERRRELTLARAVVERARGGEPERAGLDRPRARCRAIAAMSSAVAASRRAPRSPITCSRNAPCGTCTATSTSNGRPSSESMNSGNDCQFHARPSCSTTPGMSSTPSISSMRRS